MVPTLMRAERWTLGKSRTLHFRPGTRLVFSTNTVTLDHSYYSHRYRPPRALHYLTSPEDGAGAGPGTALRDPPRNVERPRKSRTHRTFSIPRSCAHHLTSQIYLASKGGKTMQKRTGGGLVAIFVSFLCPLQSVCQNRGEKSDDPKSLKKFSNY